MSNVPDAQKTNAYLIGGGIASLASAAYLIRDGHFPGKNIHILEESSQLGGSLDAQGTPESGYVMRGGRMFDDEAYTCTYDLFSFIPSLTDANKTVLQEMRDFNAAEGNRSNSKSRLVEEGRKVDLSSHGFSNQDRVDLIKLAAQSEESLGSRRIDECFHPSFFTTNFWFMWCTTFAFQPWHSAVEFKRYMLRFIQEFPRIETLAGVRRTPYNQYDAVVRPTVKWLREQGVQLELNSQVTSLDLKQSGNRKTVERIHVRREGTQTEIAVGERDCVLVTIGSMTANSSLGTMTSAPRLESRDLGGSWALWETLAKDRPELGRPSVFCGNVEQSLWESFTVTFRDPLFFNLMRKFTGNEAGTGGLVTFKDSNWLLSVVLPHQPHFLDQPRNVQVCWGYGLFPNRPGNFVNKRMSDCTGAEILTELCSQLRFNEHTPSVLASATCIPCLMPYITSQFMPRKKGDRPQVVPPGYTNLAFIGQYCEIPDDVVFTVEYSVRSAQIAVYSLLNLDKKVSPLYKGQHDIGVLLSSAKAMLK